MLPKPKRRKKSKRKRLKEQLDKLFRDAIKKRDNYTCQWCGKKVDKYNAHCSHVIPVSQGDFLRWNMNNAKVLCFHCHINKWHKDPTLAGKWFEDTFPKRHMYLQQHRHKTAKFTIEDLKALQVALQEL